MIAALVPSPSAQETGDPIRGELLEQMLDRLPDFVFRYRFRPQPRFEYVSAAVTQLTGHTPEEFYADPHLHRKFDHPDDRDVLRETVLSGGKSATPYVRWIRKDGGVVWVEQRVTCVYDEHGRIEAMEGIARRVDDPTLGHEPLTRVRPGLRIELLQRRVFVDGHEVRLTSAEYRLLVLLTERPGAVVTRDEMARYLWQSPHAGNGHTCQAHISNLRKKIPSRIVTIRGEGYRYAA